MDPNVGPMPQLAQDDVGAWLRAARERSGLSLRQIADSTKLSVRTLDLLERNRVSQLPGGIYRRSIVRAYAGEIGLDPEATLRTFLAHHPQDDDTMIAEITPLPAQPPSQVLRVVASIIGALIPVVAGLFYFSLNARGSDAPRHVVKVLPSATHSTDRAVAMLVSVTSRSQLQIVADGKTVFAGQVEAGELLRLDLPSEVILLGDDASAIHFSINGRAGRSLGAPRTSFNSRITRDDYHAWLMQP